MTIKLAIVEDETYVRKCLVNTIPWVDHDARILFDCSGGKSALAHLKSGLIPDIIISDICMPDVSGLELLETLHVHYPDIRLIFISGHDEFEYARKAVNLGASSYLLKPVEPEELILAVEKAAKTLIPPFQKRNELVHALLNGTLTMKTAEQSQPLLQELNHSFFAAICVNFYNSKKTQFLYEDLLTYCSSREDSIIRLCMLPYFMQFLVLAPERSRVELLCLETLKFLESRIRAFYGSEYTLTVSDIYTGPDSIFFATTSSVNLGNLRNIFPEQHLFRSTQNYPDSSDNIHTASRQEALVIQAIMDRNPYLLHSALDSLFQVLARQTSPLAGIYDSVSSLFHSLEERLSAEGMDFQKLLSHIPKRPLLPANGSFKDMKLRLEELFTDLTGQLLLEPSLNVDSILLKAKAYIDSHLADPKLCLSMVAGHVHLNPSYFSSLFSGQCGDTFINYINRKRIEYAKKRLLETEKKVNVISEEAGYLNTAYFSTVFKKYSGCSPSEFRSLFMK